jgi:TonB family protein
MGLTLLLSGATASAQDGLEKLLAKPPSPGSLALLIPHAREARARERWYEALQHSDPQVRATAARLLSIVGVRRAAPGLAAALQNESDESAGLELARALLRETNAHDAAVVDAAERLSSEQIVLAIATARGTAALAHLDRLLAIPLSNETRYTVMGSLIAGQQEALSRVLQTSLATRNVEAWRTVLWTAQRQQLAVGIDDLASALQSGSAEIRQLAWWQVAMLAAEGKAVPPEATSPAARLERHNSSTAPEVSFGCELAARALGAQAEALPEWLDRVRSREADFTLVPFGRPALTGALAALLTDAERKALDIEVPEKNRQRVEPDQQKPRATEYAVTRTVAELPPGYVADVLDQTGCRPGTLEPLAGAIAEYGAVGTIRKVSFIATTSREECKEAARLIVTADLIPRPTLASPDRELILLPMHGATLQCLAASEHPRTGRLAAAARHVGESITPPKKTRHVAPVYPVAAQKARREGVTVAEATIARDGCVRRMELLRSSSHTDLDAAAIDAVSQWRFTPTLLHGEPTPVIMTVTVQFVLE